MAVMEELPTRRALREARTPRSTARGVWQSVGLGLSTGFLLLMALLATLVIILPLAVGGSPLTVLTSSMEPNLPPGTLVIVKPTPIEDIRIGQVVTYQIASGRPELATHRVVSRTVSEAGEITLTTQGDANNAPDPDPIREIQLRGTVWYAIPYLGWVNTWLTGDTRAWIVPILAGALFAYAAWMLVSGIRDRRASRRDADADDAADADVGAAASPAQP